MNERNKSASETINLLEVAKVLYAKKWTILIASLLGLVIAFSYTKFCIPYSYNASLSMYVNNNSNKTTIDMINASELSASQALAATCMAILKEDVVNDSIGKKLMENYTVEQLEPYFSFRNVDGKAVISTRSIGSKLSYSTVDETELIRVTAVCGDPVIAADLCNYVSDIAPEVLIRVVGAGAVEAVGTAKIPTAPSAPNARRNAVTGFLAGFIIAAFVFVLKYLLDNTVKSGDDSVERFKLPLIGEIPFYSFDGEKNRKKGTIARLINRKKVHKDDNERQTMLDVNMPFAVREAYNTMRNNIMFSLSTEKNNIFVVTSPLPGEGKSTTTANLCISIGETNTRILLVDADLRKPVQHKMFNLGNKQGLSTVLAGMCDFEKAVHKKVHNNLDVLTAGPIPPNPSQMFASENMVSFLNRVKDKYDYVVIDTSPINVVSDPLVIAKQTAGIILVARQFVTTYDQVERAVSSTETFDANLLGIVVNSIEATGGKYGNYKAYDYKYGYGVKVESK